MTQRCWSLYPIHLWRQCSFSGPCLRSVFLVFIAYSTHTFWLHNLLFQAFLEILLGIPPPSQLRTVPLHHSSRRGVYGLVTEISLVHETNGRWIHWSTLSTIRIIPSYFETLVSCRGSLHFHAPVTGVINPVLLQTILHSPIFSAAIAQVYDSIVTAELPVRLQLQYLLERNYPSLKATSNNYACKIPTLHDLITHAQKSAVVKNIHSATHTDSCVNKFLPYCRLLQYSQYLLQHIWKC